MIKLNSNFIKEWEINADQLTHFKIDENDFLLIINNGKELVTVDDSGVVIDLIKHNLPENIVLRNYSSDRIVFLRNENINSTSRQPQYLVLADSIGVKEAGIGDFSSSHISGMHIFDNYILFSVNDNYTEWVDDYNWINHRSSNFIIYHENELKKVHVLDAVHPDYVNGLDQCHINGLLKIDYNLIQFNAGCKFPGNNFTTNISINRYAIDPDVVIVPEIVPEIEPDTNLAFELDQNYPNPFNSKTNIRFSLPVETHVRLDIFNVTGQRLMSLIDQQMSAGSHTISVDIENFSSGVYLNRLETDQGARTRKMSMLK